MQNEVAFLEMIAENPADDTPRLVFADYLDDENQPDLAAFIRLQCNFASLPEESRERARIRRELRLPAQVAASYWSEKLENLARPWAFERGLPVEVSVNMATLTENGEDLFRIAPTIRRLRLQSFRPGMHFPTNASYFSRIDGLSLAEQYLDDSALDLIVKTPHLTNLTSLDLSGNQFTDAGIRTLCRSPRLASLRALHLERVLLRNSLVAEISCSPTLGNLRTFTMSMGFRDADFSETDLRELAGLNLFRKPGQEIRLHLHGSNAEFFHQVIDSPLFQYVHALEVSHTRLPENVLTDLSSSPRARQLRELNFQFTPMHRLSLDALFRSANLPALRKINLSHCLGEQNLVGNLCQGRLFGQLHSLDLSLNNLSDAGAAHILEAPSEPLAMTTLDLIYNRISEPFREQLAEKFGEGICLFER